MVFYQQPRDYTQDLDALLVAKPPRFAAEMTSMFQDHISRPLMRASGPNESSVYEAAVEEAEDAMELITQFFCFRFVSSK